MIKHKLGFTMIEVALFIAITGLLFVGIAIGTGNSIQQQRFYDSVQTFAEFLRSVYSEVSNPQSVSDGRSNYAIYGRLITFGEEYGLDGTETSKYEDTAQRIYVYDVVGATGDRIPGGLEEEGNIVVKSGVAQDVLAGLQANVVMVTEYGVDEKPSKIAPAGTTETFIPRWGASIETEENVSTEDRELGESNLYKGSIMIVRHPRSGTINTLVTPAVVEVNKIVHDANAAFGEGYSYDFSDLLLQYLRESAPNGERFQNTQIDFCVNQFGDMVGTDYRWNVRIANNARNASGVSVVDLDLDSYINRQQVGNRCRFPLEEP